MAVNFAALIVSVFLKQNSLVCLMSTVGHCGDNAACEGFFVVLKRERTNRMKYPTMDAAKADLFNYIERFHNPRMRKKLPSVTWSFKLFQTVRRNGVESE